jgi:hypothetical protein
VADYATLAQLKEILGDLGTDQDVLLQKVLDRTKVMIDGIAKRSFDIQSGVTKLFDGTGSRNLFIKQDLVTLTQVRVRDTTQSAWRIVPLADVLLEPVDRRAGWPAQWVKLPRYSSGPDTLWPIGDRTAELTGDWNWAAVPLVVVEISLEGANRLWRARGNGWSDETLPTANAIDQVLISKAFPAYAREQLMHLTRESLVI